MGKEIERKYLVCGYGWKEGVKPVFCRQGFLPSISSCVIRVRVLGESAFLTIKGKITGITRSEYEYPIPTSDAHELLDSLCIKPIIEKNRYIIYYNGMKWEIDEFLKENHGLILAEVEMQKEAQELDLPAWVGEDVTLDSRYYNINLAKTPYSTWLEKK